MTDLAGERRLGAWSSVFRQITRLFLDESLITQLYSVIWVGLLA